MTRPKRVAIYARVSTHEQSLDPQLHELRDLADRRGWCIAGEFTDLGISGAKDRRPGLDSLIKETHRGRVDVVLVWKFDRFARSVRHLITALDDFRGRGIDFVSASDAVDTTTPGGRFMFQILGAVAELERELIRERTLAGLAAARKKGRRLGRRPTRMDEDLLLDLREQGCPVREIATRMGVSKSLVSKRLRAVHKSPQDRTSANPKKRLDPRT
jgi:DNA invertase Pin-like site-specific DNA recombinase